MCVVAMVIREYAAEVDVDGELPVDDDFEVLGFEEGELDGAFFNQSTDKMFSYSVSSLNPLEFIVTGVNDDLEPRMMTLDQDGTWTEINE